jgi:hypothetical protein
MEWRASRAGLRSIDPSGIFVQLNLQIVQVAQIFLEKPVGGINVSSVQEFVSKLLSLPAAGRGANEKAEQ